MSPGRPCPAPAELRALLDGTPDGAEDGALGAHIDGCPRCLRLLDRLRPGSKFAAAHERLLIRVRRDHPVAARRSLRRRMLSGM